MNSFYRGKVRDVYTFEDKIVMVTTNRISAFDVILPTEIPRKGAVLNGLTEFFLNQTRDICPNWLESRPHENVLIGKRCRPIMVEMVIRGYLIGHVLREYLKGKRELCGVKLPEGMQAFQEFKEPIITPTTKAEVDEDITKEEILKRGLCTEEQYGRMEEYTRKLFARGRKLANERGLTLLDTKFEFGLDEEGNVVLIDEALTPDSSRYMQGSQPLSKEFVRDWLRENGFTGEKGQIPPEFPPEFVKTVTEKYEKLHRLFVD